MMSDKTKKKLKLIGILVLGVILIFKLAPILVNGIVLLLAVLFCAGVIYLLRHLK